MLKYKVLGTGDFVAVEGCPPSNIQLFDDSEWLVNSVESNGDRISEIYVELEFEKPAKIETIEIGNKHTNFHIFYKTFTYFSPSVFISRKRWERLGAGFCLGRQHIEICRVHANPDYVNPSRVHCQQEQKQTEVLYKVYRTAVPKALEKSENRVQKHL